jgi:YD repeat-containing protein
VNYDWLGHITTITDTLARTITFNYDPNANLISITQTWNVNGVPTTHIWASFGWATKALQPSFTGVMVVGAANPSTIPVISQVGLDDGSRYTFEYNAAGQVNPIRSFRSDNVERAYTAYDYDSPADDCPRLIDTHVWAENWTGINGVPVEVATQYGAPGDGSHTVTTADGTLYKEFYGSAGASPAWQHGLVLQSEVWSGGVRQKWTTTNWTQDNTGVNYQTNARVTETNVFDASGNRRRATVSYASFVLPTGARCPLPSDTREYAADASTILRHTHIAYRMDPVADVSYLDRHIIGLVKEQTLYEVSGGTETLMSKVGFAYDETGSIQGADTPVQHDNSYDGNFVTGRANLSSVKRYDVTDISQFTMSSLKYNTAGAVVSTTDPLSHSATVSYVDSFSDGNNGRNTLAYPKTVTDADGYSSTLIYNFDFGAVTSKQTPQPNTIENLPGPVQTLTYDAAGRTEKVTSTTNAAYVKYVYGPNYVLTLSTVNNVADEAYSNTVFDGMGRTVVAARNHPGSLGGYRAVNTIYDLMGRAVKQSNPTETNDAWLPAGDDAAGWLYAQQTYDWRARPLVTTNTDLTTREASYAGCGCAGGEVVTLTDEGTIDGGVAKRRQQNIYSDVLGRTVKTEILNWQGGSVYSTTMNNYNARDQVTRVRQFDAAQGTVPSDPNDLSCPSGSCQQTTLAYDGHGRLQTKHVPEQDEGTATTWNYNADDTVQSAIDARGSIKTFSYNARRLATLVSYEPSAGITDTPDASFNYDAAGNRTAMTDGVGSKSYHYDQMSRMDWEERSFTSLGTYRLTYGYNLAGELTSFTDSFNAAVNYNRDAAGKVSSVTGSGFANISTYASNFHYRASGKLRTLTYGNNRTLSINYDQRLQPSHYEVSGVLGLDYEYYADGRVNFADDLINSVFDRSYAYDHAGRMTTALSGAEARGEPATNNRPYNQSFGYDAWDNMPSRAAKHWSRNISSSPLIEVNNRVDGWQYDTDGRATMTNSVTSTFDAAGQLIQTTSPQRRNNPPLTLTQSVDGDGNRVKKNENGSISFFLRSTVLGGALVTEIYGTPGQTNLGQKYLGHVYVNGSELAEQNTFVNTAFYKHHEPGSGELGTSYTHPDGSIIWGATQLDPFGDDVGLEDPYLDTGGGGDPGFNYPHFGDLSDPHSGCTVDGQPVPCTSIGIYLNGSSGAAKSVTAGPDAGMLMPRYEWRFNDSPGGEDACKNGICPSVVTIDDPGGYFAIAGFDIVTNSIVPRALLPQEPAQPQHDPACTRVNALFDDSGQGYYTYGPQNQRYGQPGMVAALQNFASGWNQDHPDNPIGVGDLSQFGGAPNWARHPGGGHAGGVIADLRPMRNDNVRGPTNFNDRTYSFDLTNSLVQGLLGLPEVASVRFNDPNIQGTVRDARGHVHDNHLHVTFNDGYGCP